MKSTAVVIDVKIWSDLKHQVDAASTNIPSVRALESFVQLVLKTQLFRQFGRKSPPRVLDHAAPHQNLDPIRIRYTCVGDSS